MRRMVQQKLLISFDEQKTILREAVESEVKFSAILDEIGLSYDDLTYQRSYELRRERHKPLSLQSIKRDQNDIPVVSFFTGCGGMDLGFEASGFTHVAAFEINELFCKTLRKNRPLWDVFGPPVHSGDVSKTSEICNVLSKKINSPFEGVFIGGPPCQPFSIASNQRFAKSGKNFKRIGFQHETNGSLLFDYVSLICEYRPKVFLIENVLGLKDLDGGKQLSDAIFLLERNGYDVKAPTTLDAADYGIPQQRIRLFVIGTRGPNTFKFPSKRLNRIGAGSVLLDGIPSRVSNHETRQHNASSVARYMLLDYGARDKLGRVDRLNPALPSKTVIAGGTNGGGRSHLHPEIPRTLSVRECARLQTFPDEYVFVGATARQFTQVGNSVPPVLAAQLASQIEKVM